MIGEAWGWRGSGPGWHRGLSAGFKKLLLRGTVVDC